MLSLPHSHHCSSLLHAFLRPNPNSNLSLFSTPPLASRRQNSSTFLDHNQQEKSEHDDLRRRISDEFSLSTRRIPRFPGSVEFPKPELHLALNGAIDEDKVLKRALEMRRGVAAEILKASFRAGKLSITYSTNLVSKMPDFVDRVVIGAAALKGDPELSHLSFNARAKSYIQSSGVVPLVKWLKHNSLTYPQIGKVICMCTVNLDRIRHLIEWLKSIHVKGEFLGRVLVKGGSVIIHRSFEELEGIVACLESNGVRKDWMGFVVGKSPQLLAMSMEELESRVRFYREILGLNERDFGTMVFDYPRSLGFFSLEEMNNKVKYLKQFGFSNEEMGRLLAYKPQLMGCSIEERWKPLVKYLYYLGVNREGMKRILLVKPMVFCVDLETTIAPKVQFLQEIGVKDESIGGVIVKFPAILTYSLLKKIRPVVIFLITRAGVSQENIGKVIALEPQLVGCSITKKLDVNVKYFLSLGIRAKSLGEMIADFPMLLRYNLDVISPKYRYLRRVMVRPLLDLIEFPRFVSYSLEGRIEPRHKILVKNRVNFKLRYMLAGSDKEFSERVRAVVEKRERFEAGLTNSEIYNFDDETQLSPPVSSSQENHIPLLTSCDTTENKPHETLK